VRTDAQRSRVVPGGRGGRRTLGDVRIQDVVECVGVSRAWSRNGARPRRSVSSGEAVHRPHSHVDLAVKNTSGRESAAKRDDLPPRGSTIVALRTSDTLWPSGSRIRPGSHVAVRGWSNRQGSDGVPPEDRVRTMHARLFPGPSQMKRRGGAPRNRHGSDGGGTARRGTSSRSRTQRR